MSTLRINNIEAQSVPASPTIDEKVKVTNSSGDILVNIDGKTSGITTIGINTTDGNIKFDENSNVLITGILTATTLAGNFTPASLDVTGDLDVDGHTDLDNVSVSGATTCTGGATFLNSISLNASTNNYLYFNDILHFTRNGHGTEMVIDASGRVGINESSPDRHLHVRSDGAAAAKLGGESGAAYYMEIGQLASSGSPGFNATGSSTSMLFQLNGSEKVRIDSSGRLLVATNSASAANSGADDLVIGNTSQGNNGMSIVTNNSNIGGIFFADQDNSVRGGVRYQHGSDLAQFYAGGNVVLNLKNKGVGINETSPSEDALVIRGGDTDDTPKLILKRHTDGIQNTGEIIGKIQFMSNEDNVDSGNHNPRAEIHGVTVNTSGAAKMDFYTVPNSTTTPIKAMTLTQTGQAFVGSNIGYNESASLLSVHTDSSAAATALSDSSAIYNHSNPAFLHIANRYNTGTGQEAGIIFHSKNSHNGSWAIYGKRTSNSYRSDLIFRNRTGSGSSAERMRINPDGVLSLGGSYAGSSTNGSPRMLIEPRVTGSNTMGIKFQARADVYNVTHMQFEHAVNQQVMGNITSANAGATSYNTSSDYRLKENISPISDGISRLKQLLPKKFNFIIDETNTLRDGFLAHEVSSIVPEAVTGEKDAEEMQQMDQSKLVPLLTAALQEAITKIETLEAEVAALKGS